MQSTRSLNQKVLSETISSILRSVKCTNFDYPFGVFRLIWADRASFFFFSWEAPVWSLPHTNKEKTGEKRSTVCTHSLLKTRPLSITIKFPINNSSMLMNQNILVKSGCFSLQKYHMLLPSTRYLHLRWSFIFLWSTVGPTLLICFSAYSGE